MKLHVISDVHSEFKQCTYSPLKETPKEADLTLYCGDMGQRYLDEIKGNSKYFGCTGNHYYYGNNKFKKDGYVYIKEYERYVFFATTLWTDFKYGNKDIEENKVIAERYMNDYSYIQCKEKILKAEDTYIQHLMSKKNLQWQLDKYKHKRCVVITHHAPSSKSIPKKYKGNEINCAYVSDMEEFIKDNPSIILWTHGHIHSNNDYKIGYCRVISNPRGYETIRGRNENKEFNPNLIIEI